MSVIVAVAAAIAIVWLPFPEFASQTKEPSGDLFHPLAPAYVGDAACAQCHARQSELHHASGHSRTLYATGLCETLSRLLDHDFTDPYRKGVFRYECADGAVIATYRDTVGNETRLPVQFAVGSGTHAQSFLTLVPDDTDVPKAVEHRVTLFAGETGIGLTPSHKDEPIQEPIECLGRIKHGDQIRRCIECHSTTSDVVGTQVSNLRANINCERCHGPGRRHLQAVETGNSDLAILFGPGRSSALEEVQLCGQCHRVPDSINRLPDPDDPLLARFQPIGIMQSACFRKSEVSLRCSTCHNPHATLDHDTSYANQQCLKCHTSSEEVTRLTCKVVSKANCVDCHMPKVALPPGISFRDHWIRPRKDSGISNAP